MLNEFHNVLLVDDEPDVLAVSKLALRQMKVFGIPLRIHEARSKAEAIQFFQTDPSARFLAAAIIDVVMETDHAGLELCRFIRADLNNPILPLIIRTGQAGKAPEREVIDQYDITGYIEKVEATEQRLYTILKCAVRQYEAVSYGYFAAQAMHHGIMNTKSPERFVAACNAGLMSTFCTPEGERIAGQADSHCFFSDRFFVGTGAFEDRAHASKIRDRLAGLTGVPLSETGDKLVVDGNHVLIHASATDDVPRSFQSLWTITAPPPAFVVAALYAVTQQTHLLTEHVPW